MKKIFVPGGILIPLSEVVFQCVHCQKQHVVRFMAAGQEAITCECHEHYVLQVGVRDGGLIFDISYDGEYLDSLTRENDAHYTDLDEGKVGLYLVDIETGEPCE